MSLQTWKDEFYSEVDSNTEFTETTYAELQARNPLNQ